MKLTMVVLPCRFGEKFQSAKKQQQGKEFVLYGLYRGMKQGIQYSDPTIYGLHEKEMSDTNEGLHFFSYSSGEFQPKYEIEIPDFLFATCKLLDLGIRSLRSGELTGITYRQNEGFLFDFMFPQTYWEHIKFKSTYLEGLLKL